MSVKESTLSLVQDRLKDLANQRLGKNGKNSCSISEPDFVKSYADGLRKLLGIEVSQGTIASVDLLQELCDLEKIIIERLSLAGAFGPGINPENWSEALNRSLFLSNLTFWVFDSKYDRGESQKERNHQELFQYIASNSIDPKEIASTIKKWRSGDSDEISGEVIKDFNDKFIGKLKRNLGSVLEEFYRDRYNPQLLSGVIKDFIDKILATSDCDFSTTNITTVQVSKDDAFYFDKVAKILNLYALSIIDELLKKSLAAIDQNSERKLIAEKFLEEKVHTSRNESSFLQKLLNKKILPANSNSSKTPSWQDTFVNDITNENYAELSETLKDRLDKNKQTFKNDYLAASLGTEENFTAMFQDLIELIEVGAAPYILPPLVALSAGLFFVSPAASVVASTAVSTFAPRLNGSKSTLEFLTVLAKLCNSAEKGNLASRAAISSLGLIPGYNNIIKFTSKYLLPLAYSGEELVAEPTRIQEQRALGKILLTFSIGNFK